MDDIRQLLIITLGTTYYYFNASGFFIYQYDTNACTWMPSCNYQCEAYNYNSRFLDYSGVWIITNKWGIASTKPVAVKAWIGNAIDAAGVFPIVMYTDNATGHYLGLDKLDTTIGTKMGASYWYLIHDATVTLTSIATYRPSVVDVGCVSKLSDWAGTMSSCATFFKLNNIQIIITMLILTYILRLAQLVNASGSSTSTATTESGTVISAFVIQNEDQPRVQFELFPKLRQLEMRVDGKLLEFTPLSEPDELLSSSLIYSDDHQLILRQRDANSYGISYGESGLQFIVYLRPQFDFLDFVSIIPSTFKDKKKFQGILGGFDGLAYANGTNVSASLNDDQALFTYGELWRTTSDSSLFYYRFQDSHAEHQDLNYRPMFKQDLFQKYANTDRYHMAEEVCRNMTHEQQCMFDVLITNDATMEQMHEKYEMNIQLLDEYIELVTIDIENSELTTSTSNSEITSKPQNSAVKYFTNEIWKITLFLLAVIYYY
ncbi:unnamed protein product [Adineta steineri]|uniref:Uncharacterized protein n=2 Tax=Adineta steineri TaxID=433720 RepID=A0A814TDJ2_9BILA|nr:unnamed protein product [Adineta steineri]